MEIVGESVELNKRCLLSPLISRIWRRSSSIELTNKARYHRFTPTKYTSTMNSPTDSRRSITGGNIPIIRVLLQGDLGFAAPCRQRIDRRPWSRDAETKRLAHRGREARARTDGAPATSNRGDHPRARIPLASAACGRVPALQLREPRRHHRV